MVNSSAHRSAFSQTCNLLSQYVKEKKTIPELGRGIFGVSDDQGQNDMFRPTTMSLFPVSKKVEEEQISSNVKAMDLFPQSGGIESAPLTIFYAGQVIVFNDFPVQKAKEIMELASRGVSPKPSTENTPVVNNSQQIQECAGQTTTRIVADLPIARKNSLHRFLEKRKDRIKAKVPYNTSKPGDDVPLKHEENNPWLGLAASATPPRS